MLRFNANIGQTSVQTITMTNMSEKKQAFKLTLGDWERDSVGNHRYYPAATTPRSCADWVKPETDFVELEPGQAKNIRIALNAPPTPEAVKEAKWAMLFVENAMEQVGSGNNGKGVSTTVMEVYRIGIHIYQTPPQVNQDAARVISLKTDPAKKGTYYFTMANTGATMLDCKLRLEMTNMENGKIINLPTVEFPVFPDAKRTVDFTLPTDVPKGKYSFIALLDYSENMPLEAIEAVIDIK